MAVPSDLETQLTDGPQSSSASSHGAPLPARVGRYRVDGELGRGGMGRVLQGRDERLDRPVAIKLLAEDRADDGSARARFWREARALAALDHPNIVRIYDFGETEDGALYLVMEHVPGEPSRAGRAGLDTVGDAVRLAHDVADALGLAHRAGVVHRDIKPSNLLRLDDGGTRVIDFGVARSLRSDDPTLTASGAAIGSPAYMAPEQLRGEEVTPASDVFAVGVVLFELIAGQRPFAATTPFATAIAIEQAQRPALRDVRPDVPPALEALIDRLLAREPDERPADGAALLAALNALELRDDELALPLAPHRSAAPTSVPASPTRPGATSPTPVRESTLAASSSTRPGAIAIVVAVLVLAAFVGWWLGRTAPEPPPPAAAAALWPDRPPRPFIALEVGEGEAELATIIEDVARTRLDAAPERWLVFPDDPTPTLRTRSAEGGEGLSLDAFVSARLTRDATGLAAELTLESAAGARLASQRVGPAPGPLALADRIATVVVGWLGGEPEALGPPPSPSLEALRAMSGDDDGWETGDGLRARVRAALDHDPLYADAMIDYAESLRSDRQAVRIPDVVAPVLEAERTPARARGVLEGLAAIGRGEPVEAFTAFEEVQQRWRFDRRATYLAMALVHHGRATLPSETAELATRLLEVDPGDQIALSRFIRTNQWDDRESLEATLSALGVWEAIDEDTAHMARGDITILTGDHDEAVRHFEAGLAAYPGDIYATHQRAAALILGGRCDEAIDALYEWIEAQEARGSGGNLGWTYSLTHQALVCARRFGPARDVLDRWERYDPDNAEILPNRLFVDWAEGAPAEEIAAAAQAALPAPDAPLGERDVTLLHLLALTGTDAETLRAWAVRSEGASLDLDLPRDVQLGLRRVGERLDAFARLLDAPCDADALRTLADARTTRRDDRSEREGHFRVDAHYAYGTALDGCRADDEVRAAYRAVLDAGYARLYRNATVLKAEAHLSRRPNE